MFRQPIVAMLREVLCEGYFTKKSQPMYRHKILNFKYMVDTVRTVDTTLPPYLDDATTQTTHEHSLLQLNLAQIILCVFYILTYFKPYI